MNSLKIYVESALNWKIGNNTPTNKLKDRGNRYNVCTVKVFFTRGVNLHYSLS